jgi:hypothetical protein
MEFLLLWADDLDDAMSALRHLAPKIIGSIVALLLFAATGFVLILAPQTLIVLIACAASAALLETVRRRRARLAVRED